MIIEAITGLLLGLLFFLLISGYNVLPVFLFAAFGLALYLIIGQKTTIPGQDVRVNDSNLVDFASIGGQKAAKQELREALDFMLRREEMSQLGIRPLKGILLAGPPGTGKTMLAKAAARYTEAAFLAASGSEFIEMYAGVGAQRVRSLFRQARQLARKQGTKRAVLFIDEIEVLGGRRGAHQGHLEYDQTLNQLLVEMDGITSAGDETILVLAATNRADLLDPALLRPGRFDRQVLVDLPEQEARLSILTLHCGNKPLAGDVNLNLVAQETFGFSGAQLESLANEAAIMALRAGRNEIKASDFQEAVDKVLLGEKLDRVLTNSEKRRVAVHEGGHSLISELIRPGSVSTVTITPRGNALGYVRQNPEQDLYLYRKAELEQHIRVCLAGAAAEEAVFGDCSTGAKGDYQEALRLAGIIVDAGLSELGIVDETLDNDSRLKAKQQIVAEQKPWVEKEIGLHLPVLEKIAEILYRSEHIGGQELRSLMAEEIKAG